MVESLASVCAIALVLTVVDGHPTTTSLDIARHFGKRHAHIMDTIRALLEQLPPEHQPNFRPMFIEVALGQGATRQDPAYRITRDGFTLLAMGFTGKKALQFKLAYIDAFNKMEAQIVGLHNSAIADTPALPAVKTIPRRPSKLPRPASLPPEVQPLVDATVWRMVGRAHTDIADWVERHLAYTCNLDHAGTANTRAQRAAKALEAISYEDWLTQGELNNAKNLLVFFEVAKDLGTKGTERINALIKQVI
jgi:Rha family phage regulatory protein